MPDWTQHVRPRLASLRLSPAREAEIVDELSQHLEDRWRELRAGGASEDEATRLALAEFRDGDLLGRSDGASQTGAHAGVHHAGRCQWTRAQRRVAGPALRVAVVVASSGIHPRGGAHPGARHRCEYGDLQPRRCRADPEAAGEPARRARPARTGHGARRHAEHLASPVRTPPRRKERLLGRLRCPGRARGRGDWQPRVRGSRRDRQRAGRLRGVLPGARLVCARRTRLHAGRRSHARRASGGGSEPQLLDAPDGRRSGGHRPHHHARTPAFHDRRRGAARLLWRGHRPGARDLGADDDAPGDQRRSVTARRRASRLAAGDRPAAARRRPPAGRSRTDIASRSAEGGSRPARRHAASYRQAARHRRQSGAGTPARPVRAAAAHPRGGRRPRAADRVCERGHAAAGARQRTAPRDRHPAGDRRGPPPAGAAVHDGEPPARRHRRIRSVCCCRCGEAVCCS